MQFELAADVLKTLVCSLVPSEYKPSFLFQNCCYYFYLFIILSSMPPGDNLLKLLKEIVFFLGM